MIFQILIANKKLTFDSEVNGLIINKVNYVAGQDGSLIYNQVKGIKSEEIQVQMSTNTSALIPALGVLDLLYCSYFDTQDVVNSQNDITFYWKKSKLAAFYNLYSTDEIPYEEREPVIRRAVSFLIENAMTLSLEDQYLKELQKPCNLLGFFEGFPIFNGDSGLPKLQSRLGIHIGNESVMVSSPLDKYSEDIYEMAILLSSKSGETYSSKKNRVVFKKTEKLMRILDDNLNGFS